MTKTLKETLADYGVVTHDSYNPLFENIKKAATDFAHQSLIEFETWRRRRIKNFLFDEANKFYPLPTETPEETVNEFITQYTKQ